MVDKKIPAPDRLKNGPKPVDDKKYKQQKDEKIRKLSAPVKKTSPARVGARLSGPVADGGRREPKNYKYMNVMGPAGPAPKREPKPKAPGSGVFPKRYEGTPKPTPKPKSPVSGKGYSKPVMPRRGGR
jgi:hypothetical protein